MSRLRGAARATLAKQGFETAATVIALVAVPFYLVHLGTERYGLFLVAQTWAGYLGFGNAGLSQSTMILVSHARGRENASELSKLMSTSFFLSFMAAAGVLIVSAGVYFGLQNPAASVWLKLDHAEAPALLAAMGVQVTVSLLFSPVYDLLIGSQRAATVTVFQGLNRLAGQCAGLAVVAMGASLAWITLAIAAVSLVAGVAALFYALRAMPEAFHRRPIEREQIALQLRTGMKSFGLQLGATLGGTAPTLALTLSAGPAAVPLFAVPARLMTVAMGPLNSFSALLQPAFGEAYTRRDLDWIRHTLAQVWEKTLLLLAVGTAMLVGVGGSLISLWTAGRLEVPDAMLLSVALCSATYVALAPLRFLLSGINQHQWAAVTEVASGALAVLFCALSVQLISTSAVGWGVVAATALTSAWLLPRQVAAHLGLTRLLPESSRLFRIVLCALAVFFAATLAPEMVSNWAPAGSLPKLLLSTGAGTATFAFAVIGLRLLSWSELYRRLRLHGL